MSRYTRAYFAEKNPVPRPIELINNTQQQIVDVVEEMEKRLDGTWKNNEEDDELQKRFWSHFESSNKHGIIRSKIGAKFLRENKDLL